MAKVHIGAGPTNLSDGLLQLQNGDAMDATLRPVTDQNNTASPLELSTGLVSVSSTLQIATNDVQYIDAEDTGGNNRFTVSRAVGSQTVNVDFASNPTLGTDQVGAIRTYQDGVSLSDAIGFQKNGQVTFTERVKIEADSTSTTQSAAVIQSTTTNAGLVLQPNGTGAIMAQVPDGTAAGGNARGAYAVDLQMGRTDSNRVASGEYSGVLSGYNNRSLAPYSIVLGGNNNYINGSPGSSYQNKVIVGGNDNQISNVATRNTFIGGGYANNINGSSEGGLIVGGYQNTLSGSYTVISGGQSNAVSSNYSTISGGQSNTASTNTHATVVGGFQNTSSGQYSVSGGQNNVASGSRSIALGIGNTTSSVGAPVAIGNTNISSADSSVAIGRQNTASNVFSCTFGSFNNVSGVGSVAVGNNNTISGSYGFSLGRATSVTSPESGTALGNGSLSYLYAQSSLASGVFPFGGSNGFSQQSLLTARKQDTLASAATTVLSLDGTGTTNLIIPDGNNRAWNVTVKWVAIITAANGAAGITNGDSIASTEQLLFKKVGGVSSVVGIASTLSTHSDASMASCSMAYTAGASQELALTFTGPTFATGGPVTCRVVAKVELTEVAW